MIEFGLYTMTDEYMHDYYPARYPQDKAFKRPFFLVIDDTSVNGLIWLVPLSSKTDKYSPILAKYENAGKIIHLYGSSDSVILTQNVVPALPRHIDEEFQVRQIHYVMHSDLIKKEIQKKVSAVRVLIKRGLIPDHEAIKLLEQRLLDEIKTDKFI
ncbi:MAG TPA: hypothetical protein DCP62_00120 [Erysipelotrichaceae bacterium]|nr:hypothetical protein [Erysipelotrichaceae bacterium]